MKALRLDRGARRDPRSPTACSAEEAAFVEPVNTCLKAVRKAGIERGQTVLVVGQGPIGLLLMQLAAGRGPTCSPPTRMADRLEVSRAARRRAALDAPSDVVEARCARLTAGRGADRTLLAALGPAAFRQAVDGHARRRGVSWSSRRPRPARRRRSTSARSARREKDILTSYSASVDVQDLAARLVFAREIRVRELVTHRFPLDEAPRRPSRSRRARRRACSRSCSRCRRTDVSACRTMRAAVLHGQRDVRIERVPCRARARARCCSAPARRSPAAPT